MFGIVILFLRSLHSGLGGGSYNVNDIIGVTFDLSEVIPVLKFYLNGKDMKKDIRGIRGDVFAAVSVAAPCMLSANFGDMAFKHPVPHGFDRVIFSRDVI